MKHFFQVQNKLDAFATQRLMKQAKEELAKKPLRPDQFRTKTELVCINSTNIAEYVPPGMEQYLLAKNIPVESNLPADFLKQVQKLVDESSGHVTAYIFGNIQAKEVNNYLGLAFDLQRDYDFESLVITHLSDQDLAFYLRQFLDAPGEQKPPAEGEPPKAAPGNGVKIEVFEGNAADPWTTLNKPEDLNRLQVGARRPGILAKPFFSDIRLKVKINQVDQIQELPIGKLRSALGLFNKKVDPSGLVHRAKASLFLKWKDIEGFKLSSAQDAKSLAGVSLGGEFIPLGQFVLKNVGSKYLKPEEVDFFRMRIGNEMIDLSPAEITEMEVNIETQQVIFTRGVGKTEFHIARFHRLKLYKAGRVAEVNKCIAFNRGDSNFDKIERYLGSRFAELEMARIIRQSQVELDFLGQKNVYAGDLASQLVLSSMRMLNILPLDAPCLGFGPSDINNFMGLKQGFLEKAKELKTLFERILDLSQSPNFSENDFLRLTKRIRFFLGLDDPLKIAAEQMDDLLVELELLTQYMDDFFKLNLYNRFQDNLEVDRMSHLEEEVTEELDTNPEEFKLDEDAKEFISENYTFFKKRELVISAITKVEQMRFFLGHIQKNAEKGDKEADLVVFSSRNSLVEHFKKTAYPAFALTDVLNREIFNLGTEEERLLFIQFMRGFTRKVFQKAQEVNQTFHHQYKHTLAELSFLAGEKKEHLLAELALLEDPAHKEKAYQKLLVKLTQVYQGQLKDREDRITALREEEKTVETDLRQRLQELGKILKEEFPFEERDAKLTQMPHRVEALKGEVEEAHKKRRARIIHSFNPFVKFQTLVVGYYQKVLSYVGLFQKALYITKREALIKELKAHAKKMLSQPAEELENQMAQWRHDAPDTQSGEKASQEVQRLGNAIKTELAVLQGQSPKGMFQDPNKANGPLTPYLEYYQVEAAKLEGMSQILATQYQTLNRLEQELFEAQTQVVDARLAQEKRKYLLRLGQIRLESPNPEEDLLKFLDASHQVPQEIRKELNEFRGKVQEAAKNYNEICTPELMAGNKDFAAMLARSKRRDQINEISKEAVNLNQGLHALGPEIQNEIKDLDYLKAQEANLEQVAMSKALPSTRILLKTQYIPLVEREQTMLQKADQFLSEIMGKGRDLKESFVDCFFRKRFSFPQFMRGSFCIDAKGGMKSNTVKNINAALMLLGEKWANGCSPAAKYEDKFFLKKLEITGPEAIEKRIHEIWTGGIEENLICLPPTLTLEQVLTLTDAKESLCKEIKVAGMSRHSIVLLYAGEINWPMIQQNKQMLERYHTAIMSNIFVDIDGVNIFNNRQSIYDGVVLATFGAGIDNLSRQIGHRFLTEV